MPWLQDGHTEIINQVKMWRNLEKDDCGAFCKRQNFNFSFQKNKKGAAQEIGL
jgi:hypothetical protein